MICFIGRSEHVELVLDDVLVEVSGHRGLGRIYLTDFRLVILCTDATSTSLAKTSVSLASVYILPILSMAWFFIRNMFYNL